MAEGDIIYYEKAAHPRKDTMTMLQALSANDQAAISQALYDAASRPEALANARDRLNDHVEARVGEGYPESRVRAAFKARVQRIAFANGDQLSPGELNSLCGPPRRLTSLSSPRSRGTSPL